MSHFGRDIEKSLTFQTQKLVVFLSGGDWRDGNLGHVVFGKHSWNTPSFRTNAAI